MIVNSCIILHNTIIEDQKGDVIELLDGASPPMVVAATKNHDADKEPETARDVFGGENLTFMGKVEGKYNDALDSARSPEKEWRF